MTSDKNEKPWDRKTERRKSKRRRLVDLTRMAGTDRRDKKGRRKADLDPATKRRSEKAKAD